MAEAVSSVETSPESKDPNGGWSPKTGFGRWLDRFFGIGERGSSIIRELIGGLVTFLAMFYILNVNSGILSGWFGGFVNGQVWVLSLIHI